MSQEVKLHVPLKFRKGSLRKDEIASIASARKGFKFIIDQTGKTDLSKLNILDYGCGVKYTQFIHQNNIEIASYTGVDVDAEMLSYLKEKVTDSRFKYSIVPFQNDMYNKEGIKMEPKADLGIGSKKYDLIILLSVFTHLNPADCKCLLKILKRYLAPEGRIFYTAFINDNLKGDFLDKNPNRPLLRAVFTSDFMSKAIDEADLKVDKLLDKNEVFSAKKQYILKH